MGIAVRWWRWLPFFAGIVIAFSVGDLVGKRHASPSHVDGMNATDSCSAVSGVEKGLSGKQTASSPSDAVPSTVSAQAILEQVPFSQLKSAYDARMEGLQNKMFSEFPVPDGEKAMKDQVESALKELGPQFAEKLYWSSKTEILLGKDRVPVTLLFSVHQDLPSTIAPGAVPAPSPYPVTMVSSMAMPKNICWSLDVVFPEAKKDSFSGGGIGGCLEHLSKKENLYFATAGLSGKEIEKHYMTMSVSIPQPDSNRGKIYLFETDAQQWSKDALSIDWSPITQNEALEIQNLRNSVAPSPGP